MKRSTRWRDRRFGKAPRGEGRPQAHGRTATPTLGAAPGNAPSGETAALSGYPSDRQPLQGFDYSFGAVG